MTTETTETVETEETETEAIEAAAEVESTETAGAETDQFKAKWEGQRKVNRDLERKLNEANQKLADADKSPDEKALDAARREGESAGTAKLNARLIAVEFRAAAEKRGLDPRTALKLADLGDIEVGDDGEVDPEALTAAIDAVVDDHPSLVPSRFQGTADQGGVGKSSKPRQLTREDIKTMTPEQVNAARKDGRLNTLMGVK